MKLPVSRLALFSGLALLAASPSAAGRQWQEGGNCFKDILPNDGSDGCYLLIPVSISGKVVRPEWNPLRAKVRLEIKAPDGTLKYWTVVLGRPITLAENGWTQERFKQGDTVSVTGYPSIDASTTVLATEVTVGGKKLPALNPGILQYVKNSGASPATPARIKVP